AVVRDIADEGAVAIEQDGRRQRPDRGDRDDAALVFAEIGHAGALPRPVGPDVTRRGEAHPRRDQSRMPRRNAAVTAVHRSRAPSLRYSERRWVRTVSSPRNSEAARSALVRPSLS